MPRKSLEKAKVGATIENFDFNLPLKVSGFSFQIFGKPTIKISGNKLNQQAIDALRRAKIGSKVSIFDIDAKIVGNSDYRLPKIPTLTVELAD
jgi:hypothetical protein